MPRTNTLTVAPGARIVKLFTIVINFVSWLYPVTFTELDKHTVYNELITAGIFYTPVIIITFTVVSMVVA